MTDRARTDHAAHYEELRRGLRHLGAEVPAAMAGFQHLHRDGMADGALSRATKELVALGVAICTPCEGCITYHVHDALVAGATRAEVLEAVGVAIVMGGGPAAIAGALAVEVLDHLEAAGVGASGTPS